MKHLKIISVISWFIILQIMIIHPLKGQVLGTELLNGRDKVIVDFNYAYGFILIKVKLKNILPLNFIFDTGAEHVILFKKDIADILRFNYEKRINLIGSDLEREVFALISRNNGISINNCKPVKRDLIILEDDFLNLESMVGEPIDGILGSRFFRGLVIEIDYKKKQLILHNKDKFRLRQPKNYEKINVLVENHKPYFQGAITSSEGDSFSAKLLLDSGSALPFLLFLNTHSSLQLPENVIRGNLGRGLGGDLEGYLGKVKQLKLSDNLYFNNIVTSFQKTDSIATNTIKINRNGLIGNPILSRFHVILDLIDEVVFLKPDKNYNKAFKYDRSGLVLYAFGPGLNQYYVKDIIENSPADEAGFQKGDLIKKVGIFPASFFSLSTISTKLQKKEGKKVRFTILRDGKKLRKTVVLRDLIKE
ncbi:MAG: PDZ domain-containing protein [Saprospiraceae bacterium]|nr:PDZ domain-containing protein [Saprospiraceae bacterium]